MKHIRITSLLLAIAVLAVALAACTEKLTFASIDMTTASLSVSEIAAGVKEGSSFDDTLVEQDSQITALILGLVGVDMEIAAYGSTGATAETVVFIRMADAEQSETVYTILDVYRKELATIYAAYNATESDKLTHSLLRRDGSYILFVVSPDSEAVSSLYESLVVEAVKAQAE